jgi:hypothetical protein
MTTTNNDAETIAGLFLHIMTLRRKLQWISDTTSDPQTKYQVKVILETSLRMATEESHATESSD